MRILLVVLFGIFLNIEAMDVRRQFDDMYSGNSMSTKTATYVYLCSKMNHVSGTPAEGCVTKCARDHCGPDGCCDACATGKNGLFLAAVSVDETAGAFTERDPKKIIWSGAFHFYPRFKTCCSSISGMAFSYAYRESNVRDGTLSYCDGRHDRFAKLFLVDDWLHPCDDVVTLDKYPHMRNADGSVASVLYGLNYEGRGGIYNILQTSLMRWKLPQTLSISEFLTYAGSTGTVEGGICIAPQHAGSSIFSKGYNCVAFCDALLQKMGLAKTHKLRFERDDLLKGLLDERSGQMVVHNRMQHESLGARQVCGLTLSDCHRVDEKDFYLFWR